MSARNTLIAAGILALLVGVLYVEYRIETGGEEAGGFGRKLFRIDEKDEGGLAGIDIVREDGIIGVRKRAQGWFLTSPLETAADEEAVEGVVSTLSWLEVTGQFDLPSGEGLSSYGLADSVMKIVLYGADDRAFARLEVGAETPVGSGRYARAEGKEGILTISSSVGRLLETSAASLRYARIVGVDTWKVTKLRFDRGGSAAALERKDEGWRITEPIDFPAEAAKVSSLLSGLAALRADRFAGPSESEPDLGLDHPDARLLLETEEGASSEIRFASSGAGDGLWAARADAPAIFHLSQEDAAAIEIQVEDLRDPRVAPLDRYGISEIRAESPGGSKHLVKDPESAWRWGSPDGPVVPGGAVEDLLDALDRARGGSFTPAPEGWTGGEGAASALRLSVRQGGLEPVEIELGPAKAGQIAVRSSASPYLYHLDAALVHRLEEAVDAIQAPPGASAAAGADPAKGASPS